MGFTLVELLAVIVVLAVIIIIAIPRITSTIENAKLGSMESTVKQIADSAEREYVERSTLETLDQEENPIGCNDVAKISSSEYDNCSISFTEGKAYVTIEGKGRLDGYSCTNGTKTNANCGITPDVYEEAILNGAYPRITNGMISVTIADDGTVTTIDPSSSTWYSYTAKKWANVVLVKEDGEHTREYYQNNTGETVEEEDILAYLVWIPRYKYTLWNVEGNAARYSGSTCTANCPQSISITFENAGTTKSTGSTNGTQLTHPAFTFGGVELNGIWVGKFETTPLAGTECATNPSEVDCLNVSPTIKPNESPLGYQNISTQFTTSLKFWTDTMYGLVGESRMSKNSDWGAILYLSHSEYGINGEIRINHYITEPNFESKTGCGASSTDTSPSSICEMAYGSGVSSYSQSTTGNITGIFDMHGGGWEYQMGAFTDESNILYSGICNIYNSGFNGMYLDPSYTGCNSTTNKTNGIIPPSEKYYRLYSAESYASLLVNIDYLGEALGETRNWYKSISGNEGLWSLRGASAFSVNMGITGSFSVAFLMEGSTNASMFGLPFSIFSFRTIVTTS